MASRVTQPKLVALVLAGAVIAATTIQGTVLQLALLLRSRLQLMDAHGHCLRRRSEGLTAVVAQRGLHVMLEDEGII